MATNLDSLDPDPVIDVYLKHLATGELVLASTSDSGRKGLRDSWPPVLDPDGNVVAFASLARNLDPADRDDLWDVYRKEL
jgi:hypothetical protein